MKNHFQLAALCLLFGLSGASAQHGATRLEAQKADVILIRVPHDGQFETATGLYVGQDQTSAYFVTALHPLLKAGSDDPVDNVSLQFIVGPGSYNGRVFDRFSVEKDLAVVAVALDDLPSGLAKIFWGEPKAGMPIHILGHPSSGTWSSWTGSIQNERDVDGQPEFFSTGSDPSLTNGFSGGPVFADTGAFVGMHQSSSNSASKNLKSSVILASLQAWHVPVSNLLLDDVDSRRFLISNEIVSEFLADNIDAVKSHVSPTFSDQYSNQQFRSVWAGIAGLIGNYLGNIGQTKRSVSGNVLYVTKMKFERGNADLRVGFDSSDQINGFWLITVSDHSAAELEAAARQVVSKLVAGDFQSVFDSFAPSLRVGASADVLSSAWNSAITMKGSFLRQTTSQVSSEADVVDIRCHLERGDVIVRVAFAPTMALSGVYILPA